jgi:hypothetical protein
LQGTQQALRQGETGLSAMQVGMPRQGVMSQAGMQGQMGMGGFGGQRPLQQMPNQNIPEYARPYAQQLMGGMNQMSIGRPNTDFGPAPALTQEQQYQNYLSGM